MGPAADPDRLLELSVVSEATGTGHAEKHEVQNQALAQLVMQAGPRAHRSDNNHTSISNDDIPADLATCISASF